MGLHFVRGQHQRAPHRRFAAGIISELSQKPTERHLNDIVLGKLFSNRIEDAEGFLVLSLAFEAFREVERRPLLDRSPQVLRHHGIDPFPVGGHLVGFVLIFVGSGRVAELAQDRREKCPRLAPRIDAGEAQFQMLASSGEIASSHGVHAGIESNARFIRLPFKDVLEVRLGLAGASEQE